MSRGNVEGLIKGKEIARTFPFLSDNGSGLVLRESNPGYMNNNVIEKRKGYGYMVVYMIYAYGSG